MKELITDAMVEKAARAFKASRTICPDPHCVRCAEEAKAFEPHVRTALTAVLPDILEEAAKVLDIREEQVSEYSISAGVEEAARVIRSLKDSSHE